MDYRKWDQPEIENWKEDPSSRKKLYASDLWEFGLGCYPVYSCYNWYCWPNDSCCPRRSCWPRRGCWPRRSCWPRQGCWPR